MERGGISIICVRLGGIFVEWRRQLGGWIVMYGAKYGAMAKQRGKRENSIEQSGM